MNQVTQLERTGEVPLAHFVLYFLRLGTFGFGGPIVLASRMESDLVRERHWIKQDDYLEGLALAQLAPGPLAAQLAMYLGYVRAGIWGSTLVGVSFVAPSFLMVLAISVLYVRYGGLPWMQAAFYGIGAAVIAIMVRSVIKLGRTTLRRDPVLWSIFAVLAASTAYTGREIFWLFVLSGLISMAIKARPYRGRATLCLIPPAMTVLTLPAWKHWQLFLFFIKASLFVFGSGLAIVPFLHGGVVEAHQWLDERQFLDAIAVAMITPGPVVITVAFIGFLVGGFTGAVLAAIGVFLPVYLINISFAPFYRRLSTNQMLQSFVKGVTAAATGAIAGAIVVIARHSIRDLTTIAICVLTFAALRRWKLPEPVVVTLAGIAGLLLFRFHGSQ